MNFNKTEETRIWWKLHFIENEFIKQLLVVFSYFTQDIIIVLQS